MRKSLPAATVLVLSLLLTGPGGDVFGAAAESWPLGGGPVGGPKIVWSSDPVKPNETLMLSGDGFADGCEVEVARVADAPAKAARLPAAVKVENSVRVKPLQTSGTCVKFVIPKRFAMGAYACRVRADGKASNVWIANVPDTWWLQGDETDSSTPGGWLRVFGRCMNLAPAAGAALRAGDGKITSLSPRERKHTDTYSLSFDIPPATPEGAYTVLVHNGFGGAAGWREAGAFTVKKPTPWPDKIFDVGPLMRKHNNNAERAIGEALALAKANGGGIVYVPRGYYRDINTTLKMPARTVLKGEGKDLTFLNWKDRDDPLPALVWGTNSFAVRDISITARNHQAGILSDLGYRGGGGNVWVERVHLRMNRFRGIYNRHRPDDWKEELDNRRYFGGRFAAIQLGGRNVHVTDCDVWITGHSLILDNAGGVVARNKLLCPTDLGIYWIRACKSLILEDNEIQSGGNISCYNVNIAQQIIGHPDKGQHYSTASRTIYYGHNRVRDSWKWDAEVMTVDCHPPVNLYAGPIVSAEGTKITLSPTQQLFHLDPNPVQRTSRQARMGETYLLVTKITAYKGSKWDLHQMKVYGPDDPPPGDTEPTEWDTEGTPRDCKSVFDRFGMKGEPGCEVDEFRVGPTWQSVIHPSGKKLLFEETFSCDPTAFKAGKTHWRGDWDLAKPLGKNMAVINGSLKSAASRIPPKGGRMKVGAGAEGGWFEAWRPVPETIDMDRNATYYVSCLLRASKPSRLYVTMLDSGLKKRKYNRVRLSLGFATASPPRGKDYSKGRWAGALVLIADGRGAGQYHYLRGGSMSTIEVDRPWGITPDKTSFVIIPRSISRTLFVGNTFQDAGNLQMWGGSFDVIADGNRFIRSHGLYVFGKAHYGGLMPSWRCQLRNNSRIGPGAASIGGNKVEPYFRGPLGGLHVVRGNRNQSVGVGGELVDCIVEDNVDNYMPQTYDGRFTRMKNGGFALAEAGHTARRDSLTWLDNKKGFVYRNNQLCKPYAAIKRVYVNGAKDAGGDGMSWSGAVKTLAEGVRIAQENGIEMIWVAKGTYITATGKKQGVRVYGQRVYGGFAGDEPPTFDVRDRDLKSNETILTRKGTGEVLFWHGSTDVRLDGFTITGGNNSRGAGGVRATPGGIGSVSVIANCRFLGNSGGEAGAIIVGRSGTVGAGNVLVMRCHFEGNATPGGSGGVYVGKNCRTTFEACTFTKNKSTAGPPNAAGAIGGDEEARITVRDCRFVGNTPADTSGNVVFERD